MDKKRSHIAIFAGTMIVVFILGMLLMSILERKEEAMV